MSGCPLGAGWGNVHFIIYILVLDIYSQLGGICQLDKYIWVSGLGNVRFVILGPGRPSAGGPRMDC